jgi:hypothetical protein
VNENHGEAIAVSNFFVGREVPSISNVRAMMQRVKQQGPNVVLHDFFWKLVDLPGRTSPLFSTPVRGEKFD